MLLSGFTSCIKGLTDATHYQLCMTQELSKSSHIACSTFHGKINKITNFRLLSCGERRATCVYFHIQSSVVSILFSYHPTSLVWLLLKKSRKSNGCLLNLIEDCLPCDFTENKMLSASLLGPEFTTRETVLSLNFNPQLTIEGRREIATAGVVYHWTVSRGKALSFARPSESPSGFCTSCELDQRHSSVQRSSIKSSAHTWLMGGGVILPRTHPAAAVTNESRGVTPARSSTLQEGDGVVIVDHGSRRAESNVMLRKPYYGDWRKRATKILTEGQKDEFVKMYKEETGQQLVEAAHMELATPTIADAFDRCVEQGAKRVIICPYFFFPGRHWDKDIPALAAEAAKKYPRVSYLVTAPIGLHKSMVMVIQDRMEYCLSQVAGEVSECDMCKGTGRCKQLISPDTHSNTDTLGSPIGTLTPT